MAGLKRRSGADIHQGIAGRERELLHLLKLDLPKNGQHRRCPFPDHQDEHPSWRWDDKKRRWFCTCAPKGGTVIDAVMRLLSLDFKDAANFVRKTLRLDGEAPARKPRRRARRDEPLPKADAPAP